MPLIGSQSPATDRFKRGDHLRVRRPLGYFHHGIFVNDHRVIQFGRGIADKPGVTIGAVSLSGFEKTGTAEVVEHGRNGRFGMWLPEADAPDKIVRRAEWLLANHLYTVVLSLEQLDDASLTTNQLLIQAQRWQPPDVFLLKPRRRRGQESVPRYVISRGQQALRERARRATDVQGREDIRLHAPFRIATTRDPDHAESRIMRVLPLIGHQSASFERLDFRLASIRCESSTRRLRETKPAMSSKRPGHVWDTRTVRIQPHELSASGSERRHSEAKRRDPPFVAAGALGNPGGWVPRGGRPATICLQMADHVTRVLEQDPELAENVDPKRVAAASANARAVVIDVECGEWAEQQWPRNVRDGLGLLILDGLLLRHVDLDGRFGGELLARGDLLRPWHREHFGATVPRRLGWRVLRHCRLALLDLDFAKRIAAYPEIHGQLLDRALRRSRYLTVNMAIVHQPKVETRLHMLLWHLADRWGTVRKDDVLVPAKLTHSIFAALVAARRPTVSAALSALEHNGQIARSPDGWLLYGAPPGELQTINILD